ncbi:MAG TPA: ABC transporter permease subunit [Acidimicrobiales bacterium]|nr:ABC transporter permease subunit [Acidimicrobiales bacterium]
MTWVAWRVQRLQFLAAAAAVLIFALWLLTTAMHEHTALTIFSQRCSGGQPAPICAILGHRYFQSQRWDSANRLILYAIPGILGVILGAPLVAREVEHGTSRVAWTQSITRTHWLAAKLLVAGLVTAAVIGLLIPLEQWWTGTLQLGPHINPDTFDVSGIVNLGYGLFAFMLGAALGAVFRRTGWAIVAGLPLFVLFRALVRFTIRPGLVSPEFATASPNPFAPSIGNAWALNSGYVPLGRTTPATGQTWNSGTNAFFRCFSPALKQFQGSDAVAGAHCATVTKLHFVVRYQPESRYWALQTAETAVFLAAGLVLLGITVLAVRRWRT